MKAKKDLDNLVYILADFSFQSEVEMFPVGVQMVWKFRRGGYILGANFGKSRGEGGMGSYNKSLLWGVWIFSGTTQYG